MPRDVEWEGRVVHTAIWKDPVPGRRLVRRLNVDGDGQGDLHGHGGVNRAVFVYQTESYRYWREFLGRDDFTYGQFGENFTVEGLADDEVCVGDRYRIGSGLFEVSQPRVTCYRVGIRMSEPQMPSLLVAHRRPGFYLRVLEEGDVEAGDTVERVERGPEAMTVAEIDGLLYLPNHARRDLIRALRIPALSEGWQGSFRDLLEQAPDGEAAKLAWQGLRRLRVTAIDRESETVISVGLEPVDSEPAVPAQPGQFLTIRLRPGPGAAPLLRTYSLSGVPNVHGYRISVKREPHGAASGYVHTGLRVRCDRGRRAARLVHPASRRSPGGAHQRRGRRDAGARDVARSGRRTLGPSGVVVARSPQRCRARVRGRGPWPAGATARRPPRRLLQPAPAR
jgi:MOSC domain-containing protein YiiM